MFLETLYFSKVLYFFTLLILTTGLFIMLSSDNYVRKIIGLSIMQSSVLIFYLILGKVGGGIIPIERNFNSSTSIQQTEHALVKERHASTIKVQYSSPVPQVLMLTAIVVGFATLSVGLALISLIAKQFSTICESKIPGSPLHFDQMEE